MDDWTITTAIDRGPVTSFHGRPIGRYGFEDFLEVKSLVMRIGCSRAPWVQGGA